MFGFASKREVHALKKEVAAEIAALRARIELLERVAAQNTNPSAGAMVIDTGPKHRKPPRGAVKTSALPVDEGCLDLGSGNGFSIAVVGESRRQAELRKIAGARLQHGEDVRFIAYLEPEPDNPYDSNAVKVCDASGAQLGYLSRGDAAEYQLAVNAVVQAGKRPVCHARLIGGTADKPSIGVVLDLALSTELLDRVGGQPF